MAKPVKAEVRVKEVVAKFEPLAVRRRTAAEMLQCSETSIWKMIREGRLRTIKIGADHRVLVESIREFAK